MGTKTRVNDQGFLEGYDEESGEIVWVEKRKTVLKNGKLEKASTPGRGRPKKVDTNTHHYVVDGRGEKLWVPKGTNPENLPRTIWPFNQVTADEVCRLLTEGKTIKSIGEMEGMPPAHIIHKWGRKYPEFKREMKQALEDRATYFADLVMETATTTNKDTIMEDRLKTELWKWGAEIGDPNTYGKKTKITADGEGGVAGFIICTGVPQKEPEPTAIDVESRRIEEPSHDV